MEDVNAQLPANKPLSAEAGSSPIKSSEEGLNNPLKPTLETLNLTELIGKEQKLASAQSKVAREDQELFEKTKARIEKVPDDRKTLIKEIEKRNVRAIADYKQRTGRDLDEERVNDLNKSIRAVENAIRIAEDKLRFLRPKNKADIEYRLKVQDELSPLILKNIPDGLPLRFHGTPIYNAEHIIEAGELSSSGARLGVETSHDTAEGISVTKPETIWTTLSYLEKDNENYQLPAGCIFVVLPKSAEDAQLGDSMIMLNVYFRENPQRLFGVLASPEMLPKVKEWMTQSGLDSNKATNYFAFVDQLKQLKQNISNGSVKLGDIVGYQV